MQPKLIFVRNVTKKAVKTLSCLVLIFLALLVNIPATIAQNEKEMAELLAEIGQMKTEIAQMKTELREQMKAEMQKEKAKNAAEEFWNHLNEKIVDKFAENEKLKTMSCGNGTQQHQADDVLPWLLSIASKLSPDLLSIFMGLIIAIFAWRTSDISALREKISNLDNSKAKAEDIQNLRYQIVALEISKAKAEDFEKLRDQIVALEISKASAADFENLRNQIVALDNSKASAADFENLRNQIVAKANAADFEKLREKVATMNGYLKGMEKKVKETTTHE